MADRAKKITELPALTSATGDDLVIVVDDPSGTANTKKITVSNFLSNSSANIKANYLKNTAAPSTSSTTGVVGEIRFDSSYIYVCIATNTWKRASLSTW